MKQLFIVLTLISLFSSNSLFAQSLPLYEFLSNEYFNEYVIVDQESSVWSVKIYRENHGEMQDLKEERTFDDFSKARAYKNEYIERFHQQYPQPLEASPIIELTEEGDIPVEAVVVSDVIGFEYVTEAPETHIWVAKNQWSTEWEEKYGLWIQENLKRDFFSEYNIQTDCADVVIGLRWIFARMNSLPAMNTLSGSGNFFGNMSMKKDWRGLIRADQWHQDQVFLQALEYVMRNTYTRSLKQDSYSIQINQEAMYSGAHHLEFHSQGGHAMMLQNVKVTRGLFGGTKLTLMDSTLPRKVRNLKVKGYQYGLTPEYGSGFLRMRWPVKIDGYWELTYPEDHPYFSEEQYEPNFTLEYGSFAYAIKGRLSGKKRVSQGAFRTTLKELKKQLDLRAKVVREGFEECQKINCAPGSEGWQEWSTPVRDNRLFGLVSGAANIAEINKRNSNLMEVWNEYMSKRIRIKKNKSIKMEDMIEIYLNKSFGSDPRDSIEVRWGLN
jgi:hypothetical protein